VDGARASRRETDTEKRKIGRTIKALTKFEQGGVHPEYAHSVWESLWKTLERPGFSFVINWNGLVCRQAGLGGENEDSAWIWQVGKKRENAIPKRRKWTFDVKIEFPGCYKLGRNARQPYIPKSRSATAANVSTKPSGAPHKKSRLKIK